MKFRYFCFLICVWVPIIHFTPVPLNAQNGLHFLYGRIITNGLESYEGPIRWGDEEVFWTDVFNSTKTLEHPQTYVGEKPEKGEDVIKSDGGQYRFFGFFLNWPYGTIRLFECQFGDIQSLKIKGSARVDLELKNGHVFQLKGGSNDIGTSVQIVDPRRGQHEIPWHQIQEVHFMDSPARQPFIFGDPLTGMVETIYGEFTGLVEWDQDERLGTDILNGTLDTESVKIPFSEVRAITKLPEGSMVELVDGEVWQLSGSNDVNSENRGIVVTVRDIGRIEIPWEAFVRVTFDHNAEYNGPAYSDFPPASYLKGTVYSKTGEFFSGKLIFDQDESLDIEFLQGKSGLIEYHVPFRNILSVKPLDDKSSSVLLKNGHRLTLSNMQDVSSSNDGLYIQEDAATTSLIQWKEIDEIRFR